MSIGSLCVVLQSLLDGVDLEDLGMHCMDRTMQEHKDISLPKETVFPSWLKDYCKVNANASSFCALFGCAMITWWSCCHTDASSIPMMADDVLAW